MLLKVKKDVYEEKEMMRYQLMKLQKPDWKEESKAILKKIENYIIKGSAH